MNPVQLAENHRTQISVCGGKRKSAHCIEGEKMYQDFSRGPIWRRVMEQSIPMMIAQLVQLLYNLVDRIYIGHLPGIGGLALTGIGLTFPITTLIAALTNLFSVGGAPLFSIAYGNKDSQRAEKILNQVAMMLVICAIVVSLVCNIFRKEILFFFGASESTYPYANEYIRICLFGTVFTMLSTGLNPFIGAQGYPHIGMLTSMLGALTNITLDPILIFGMNMGLKGAAVATVIAQIVSAFWVFSFFLGKKTRFTFRRQHLRLDGALLREICALGTAGFVMDGTNCLVQIVNNVVLRSYGDIYIGVMTVITSLRDVLALPALSITRGAQPVISFNYGARHYDRVKSGIRFSTILAAVYTLAAWSLVVLFPRHIMRAFTSEETILLAGGAAVQLYFCGFVFMAFQTAGQTVFTALSCPKRAIFFSLLRKAFLVVPLTLILPQVGFGVNGVFIAEPCSNIIGGIACYMTMWLTVYRKLPTVRSESRE